MARPSRILPLLLPALRALRQRPQLLGCGCVPVLIVLALVVVLVGRQCTSPEAASTDARDAAGADAPEIDASPRLLLNRVWFDALPEKPTDTIDLWIFLAGGLGIHEKGSSYRASFDLFEFERRGSDLVGRTLQDGKPLKTTFAVRSCDDHEPFTLCLTLQSVGGKRLELYGFGGDDEMDRHVPGSRAILAAARARGDHTNSIWRSPSSPVVEAHPEREGTLE